MSTDKSLKIAVITGGNSGIGYAAAQKLLSLNQYHVIMASRNEEKSLPSVNKLKSVSPNVEFMKLDISDRTSINQFVQTFTQKFEKLDVLVNNAGIVCQEYKEKSGHELSFVTNHLGTMELPLKLLPMLQKSQEGRIVMISSSLYSKATADPFYFKSLTVESFNGMKCYQVTKLYNIWFSKYLAQKVIPTKYPDSKIQVAIVSPGFIPTTGLSRESGWGTKILMKFILPLFPFTTTVEDAAQRIYFAISQPDANGKLVEGPDPRFVEVTDFANDMEKAKLLWNDSCNMLELPEFIVEQ
ncbi:hypothetical protein BKA69DRAFT_1122448 [Paraphysoderma sedebokerense]|nr:hypothetical protein BKA69DRAFT_1122448 [Paraphysoderma sedebokerense]